MVRFAVVGVDRPTLFVLFLQWFENTLQIRASLARVGEGPDKFERVRAVEAEGRFGIGRFGQRPYPKTLAIFIQQFEAQILQAALEVMVGAVPDRNAVNALGGFQVQFPPGLLGEFGVGGGFLVVIAVGLAINGEAGWAVEVGAALRSLAAQGDVRSPVEDLDLRQG